ncbi:hypothetical protein SISNIDRAFT_487996 [Sistotremastrum niveocremeum HHB9708]|uniref:JmjC domain-containing protein n=1 Tax=Sistotremastrum niveocremeum HHB9708 TaxID=1314777 RepID=A0A164RXW5_9AGAM|nr:hypothetical protein SISNIDRAFT_487996 [Sistotremastrum niveocremeum HHB9708]
MSMRTSAKEWDLQPHLDRAIGQNSQSSSRAFASTDGRMPPSPSSPSESPGELARAEPSDDSQFEAKPPKEAISTSPSESPGGLARDEPSDDSQFEATQPKEAISTSPSESPGGLARDEPSDDSQFEAIQPKQYSLLSLIVRGSAQFSEILEQTQAVSNSEPGLRALRETLQSRKQEIAEQAIHELASFKAHDIGQKLSPPVIYIVLEKLIHRITSILNPATAANAEPSSDPIIVYVDEHVYEYWVSRAVNLRSEILERRKPQISRLRLEWYSQLVKAGLNRGAGRIDESTCLTPTMERVENIVSLAELVATANDVVENICAAALGVVWFTLVDKQERSALLQQVHDRIVRKNGGDSDRTKRLLTLFNCATDSDRNALNPIKLEKMFLSSLGIGPSVLSGGADVLKARSSLEIMILDIVVPDYESSVLQGRLDDLYWKAVFSMIDGSNSFVTKWSTLLQWTSTLPPSLQDFPDVTPRPIVYIGPGSLQFEGIESSSESACPEGVQIESRDGKTLDDTSSETVVSRAVSQMSDTDQNSDHVPRTTSALSVLTGSNPPLSHGRSLAETSKEKDSERPLPSQGSYPGGSLDNATGLSDQSSSAPRLPHNTSFTSFQRLNVSEEFDDAPMSPPLVLDLSDEMDVDPATHGEALVEIEHPHQQLSPGHVPENGSLQDNASSLIDADTSDIIIIPVINLEPNSPEPESCIAEASNEEAGPKKQSRKRGLEHPETSKPKRRARGSGAAGPTERIPSDTKPIKPVRPQLRDREVVAPSLELDGLEFAHTAPRVEDFSRYKVVYRRTMYDSRGQPSISNGDWDTVEDSDMIRHMPNMAIDKKWRNQLLNITFKPTANSDRARSIVRFSSQQWKEKLKNDPADAERLLQTRCVAIMGAGTYRGLPGFTLDGPEPEEISPIDYDLEATELKARIKERRLYEEKVRSALRKPDQSTISKILALLHLDENIPRQVNDLTRRNVEVRAGKEGTKMCAIDTLSKLYNDPPTQAVNFLVLNGTHDGIPDEISPFVDTEVAHNHGFMWKSKDCGKRSWVIAGQDGVVSRAHGDPNGAATFIECLSGVKGWAVRPGEPMSRKDKQLQTDKPDLSKWEIYILFPGDKFSMPPGTIHAVATLETSVCRGVFYYPRASYFSTLCAVVEEHIAGLNLTNSNDPTLSANFFRLWMHYEEIWRQHFSREQLYKHPAGLPTIHNMMSLAVLINNIHDLTPQLALTNDDPEYLWPQGYKHDREATQKSLASWFQIIDEGLHIPYYAKLRTTYNSIEAQVKATLNHRPDLQQRDLWDALDYNSAKLKGKVYWNTIAAEDSFEQRYQMRTMEYERKHQGLAKSEDARLPSQPKSSLRASEPVHPRSAVRNTGSKRSKSLPAPPQTPTAESSRKARADARDAKRGLALDVGNELEVQEDGAEG